MNVASRAYGRAVMGSLRSQIDAKIMVVCGNPAKEFMSFLYSGIYSLRTFFKFNVSANSAFSSPRISFLSSSEGFHWCTSC